MNEKQIIDIARIKLPLVVEVLNRANLEAQKAKPDLDKLQELLSADELDGFYDVSDLLHAYSTTQRIVAKTKSKPAPPQVDKSTLVHRLSIPGNTCVHCGTVMGERLKCPGCGWIDPATKQVDKGEAV